MQLKRKNIMKYFLIIVLSTLLFVGCKTKNDAEAKENLPKDISLKPENNLSQQQDKEPLTKLIKEIEATIQKETCTDAADWNFAPIGAKPCGGPSSYIAYPKKMESQILPQIEKFTEMQTAFNKKYQLISDCMLITEPTGIECVDGKAVLTSENTVELQ